MSQEQEKARLERGIDEEELKRRAYNAVKAASDWLADMRRASDDEVRLAYSDRYTAEAPAEDESGFMSSAEGMTALFMIYSYKDREDTDVHFSPRVPNEDLTYDVKWLLGDQDEDDKEGGIEDGRYCATPYLPLDATSQFTDAVSFTTTTLQEAIGNPKVDVSNKRLRAGVKKNAEWLLTEYKGSVNDHDGVGWAWCGASEMEEMDREYPPQRYFTYAAFIALADIYNDDNIDTSELDTNEDIEDILSKAIKGMVSDYWIEGFRGNGWTEFTPSPYGQESFGLTPNEEKDGRPLEDVFSTGNTLVAISYAWNRLPRDIWEKSDLTEEEEVRIQEGIDYLIDITEDYVEAGELHKKSAEYMTGATIETSDGRKKSVGYFDGTLPYVIMNALSEVHEAGGPFEYRDEDIHNLKITVIEYILDNCWSGKERDGFKHIDPNVENRSNDPPVIYATLLAIESLLNFGIEPRREGVAEQVMKKLGETQNEIEELLSEGSLATSSSEGNIRQMDDEFTSLLMEAKSEMDENDFSAKYNTLRNEVKPGAESEAAELLAGDDLKEKLKQVNSEKMLEAIRRCYFAVDAEEYNRVIQTYVDEEIKKYWDYVFKPHQEAIKTLESMSKKDIEDNEERASEIISLTRPFAEDGFLAGRDPHEEGERFNERFG